MNLVINLRKSNVVSIRLQKNYSLLNRYAPNTLALIITEVQKVLPFLIITFKKLLAFFFTILQQ